MPKQQSRWDMPNKTLGMSATDYVRNNCARLLDRELALDLNAAGFDTNRAAVEKKRERLGIGKMWVHGNSYAPYEATSPISESSFAKYDSPPVIEIDKVVILPDLQMPFHEANFTNRVLELGKSWNVKYAILAGDLLENAALTHFDPAWLPSEEIDTGNIPNKLADDLLDLMADIPKSSKGKLKKIIEKHGRTDNKTVSSISQEWHHARMGIRELIGAFDHNLWIMGNHTGRLLRQMQSPLLPADVKRLFVGDDNRVDVAPYYFAIVKSGGVEWRIVHPKSAGRDDPQIYASKLLCNIVMAHSHHWNLGKDRSGKFFAISTGAMVDESRLPYIATRDQKTFQHLLGATFIMNGKPYLVGEDTDFDAMKKMYG